MEEEVLKMGAPKLYFVFSPKGTRNYEKSLVIQKWANQLPNRVYDVSQADLILSVGGDGRLLHAGHEYYLMGIPLFGVHCGTVGFALNRLTNDDLKHNGKSFLAGEDLVFVEVGLLDVTVYQEDGAIEKAIAINEVCLKAFSAIGCCSVRGENFSRKRTFALKEIWGDGVIVSTPFGSTAYNYKAGGVILPLDSKNLAITGNNTGTTGSLKPKANQEIVLETVRGPLTAYVDHRHFDNAKRVVITPSIHKIRLAFRKSENFELRRYNLAMQDRIIQDLVEKEDDL